MHDDILETYFVRCGVRPALQTKKTTHIAEKSIITAKIFAISMRLLDIEFKYVINSFCAPSTFWFVSSTLSSILKDVAV
jgi:hypothetical protein